MNGDTSRCRIWGGGEELCILNCWQFACRSRARFSAWLVTFCKPKVCECVRPLVSDASCRKRVFDTLWKHDLPNMLLFYDNTPFVRCSPINCTSMRDAFNLYSCNSKFKNPGSWQGVIGTTIIVHL